MTLCGFSLDTRKESVAKPALEDLWTRTHVVRFDHSVCDAPTDQRHGNLLDNEILSRMTLLPWAVLVMYG